MTGRSLAGWAAGWGGAPEWEGAQAGAGSGAEALRPCTRAAVRWGWGPVAEAVPTHPATTRALSPSR